MLEIWRIIAVIGVVVFLLSVALPLLSIQWMGTFSLSLLDVYNMIIQGGLSSTGGTGFERAVLGLAVTIILFPVTAILGMVSAAANRRKLCLVAGIFGIVCWLGAIWAILGLQSLLQSIAVQHDMGIFIGFIGSVIMLASYIVARIYDRQAKV